MRVSVVLAALAAAVPIAGCGHVPVATIWKLSTLDATAIDPAAVRVGMRYPKVLSPRPGGAKLTLTTVAAEGGAPRKTSYVLIEEKDGAAMLALRIHERRGDVLSLFKLSDEDVERARRQQAEHRKAAAQGRRGASNLEAAVDACRTGALPDAPLLASTYLMLDAAQGFLPVVVDVDLKRELGAENVEAHLPPC